ncbi:unnamed protein product, partial [Ectocarpus sp. 8 AP-2014]
MISPLIGRRRIVFGFAYRVRGGGSGSGVVGVWSCLGEEKGFFAVFLCRGRVLAAQHGPRCCFLFLRCVCVLCFCLDLLFAVALLEYCACIFAFAFASAIML